MEGERKPPEEGEEEIYPAGVEADEAGGEEADEGDKPGEKLDEQQPGLQDEPPQAD